MVLNLEYSQFLTKVKTSKTDTMATNQYNLTNPGDSGAGTWTYAGELALPYVHAAVLSAPTLHGGNVTLLDGVRYQAIIPVMTNSGLIIPAACDFSTAAVTLLSEQVLVVTAQMVNLQLCKQSFNNSDYVTGGMAWWQGDAYSNEQGVPDDFADALLLYVAKQVQADIENNIWMGNSTGSAFTAFNGLKLASGDTAGASPLTGDITTAANVIAGLQSILTGTTTAAPALIGDFENVSIYVNPVTISAYNLAVGQTGNGYNNAVANGAETSFLGYKLVSCPGIASGEACMASKRNLFVGIGTTDSDAMAQALDMTPLDGSNNYRITMRFAVGTQVGVAADAVWFV
tara:strand:+ start:335 stop:1366 length:1032 start_codon:yes stop_codon:yes gene_type:complete